MSQTAKVQEPSMEEILASIRRIIADDDASKTAKPAAPAPVISTRPGLPPAPPAAGNSQDEVDAMLAKLDMRSADPPAPEPPASDVLDLTEEMAAPPASSQTAFRTIDASSDVVFTDRPADQPAEPRRAAASPLDAALISASTVAAVDSAFNALAHTVIGQNARTLEDLVKEMLRPLLKSWLDDNLPGVVDRIVRTEIERVSRGR
jgi:hypothetical protein